MNVARKSAVIFKNADDRTADIEELKHLKEASPARYRNTIQKQIDNIYSGISGERDAAHFINREFGSSERIAILHDVRIGVEDDFAQIDHLVIHRFQAKAWVLETKNFRGRLSCDEHGDWTVWRNSKPHAIPSPTNQAQRHCVTLRLWLEQQGFNTIRAIEPVVLISPTSSINRKNIPTGTHVVKSDNFGEWWRRESDRNIGAVSALALLGRHLIKGLSADEFNDLGNRLAEAHVPAQYDWRAMLRLPLSIHDEGLATPHQAGEVHDKREKLGDGSQTLAISTPHGEVTILKLPDGRYALRNERNDDLIDLVKGVCRGKGQWNPRFRNWIIAEETLPSIIDELKMGVLGD